MIWSYIYWPELTIYASQRSWLVSALKSPANKELKYRYIHQIKYTLVFWIIKDKKPSNS